MGYIVTGVSFGLVGGPIIGGILSDRSLIGADASLALPFYAALSLVVVAIVLVLVFFRDIREDREPFVFRPTEVFASLWRVTKFPLVMRIMPVYSLFMIANVTFYVFIGNYLTSAFGYGVIGVSAVMLVIGVALASSSTFLVKPAQQRFDKNRIVRASLLAMVICASAVAFAPVALLCYVAAFFFYFLFGVSYPTILGLFSGSVAERDQGWIMGVTTAVFCLAGGIMSLIGGDLMSIDIRVPFFIVIAAAALGLVALHLTWNGPEVRRLIGRADAPGPNNPP
jgi:predicted MFS family arabinose efflux permease